MVKMSNLSLSYFSIESLRYQICCWIYILKFLELSLLKLLAIFPTDIETKSDHYPNIISSYVSHVIWRRDLKVHVCTIFQRNSSPNCYYRDLFLRHFSSLGKPVGGIGKHLGSQGVSLNRIFGFFTRPVKQRKNLMQWEGVERCKTKFDL